MNNKKIIALFIIVIAVVAMTLTSCDTVNDIVGKLPIFGEDHQHVFSDATCTAPKSCDCGATEGEALGHTFAEGKCSSCGAEDPNYVPPHVHNYESVVTAPTCTEAGYTTYTCACGDTYTADEVEAAGHSYESVVTAPTCTADGYTTYTCTVCSDSYTADAVETEGHKYESVVTDPTCTADGYTTYTCSCGDTYTEETEKLGHIDENLDVSCDRAGCTGKVAPAADSVLSNFTANNLGSKLSTSASYYVVGTVVEVLDSKNGVFYLDDGTGEKFYIRLPKNADEVVHANWEMKLVLGDKIQVYGKINKFTSTSAPNGSYWPSIQGGVVTILEQHPHDYTNTPATCFFPAYCVCGANNNTPLGHSDANGDKVCDVCQFGTSTKMETVLTHYDSIKDTDNVTANEYIFPGEKFNMIVEKGINGSLNTNSTNYIRVQNYNNVVVKSLNGEKIVSVAFVATSSSYVDELQAFLTSAGYTYTTNDLEVTITVDSLESITLANSSKKVARIARMIVIYEEATVVEE